MEDNDVRLRLRDKIERLIAKEMNIKLKDIHDQMSFCVLISNPKDARHCFSVGGAKWLGLIQMASVTTLMIAQETATLEKREMDDEDIEDAIKVVSRAVRGSNMGDIT